MTEYSFYIIDQYTLIKQSCTVSVKYSMDKTFTVNHNSQDNFCGGCMVINNIKENIRGLVLNLENHVTLCPLNTWYSKSTLIEQSSILIE